MSRSGIVALLITAFVLGSPAWSADDCQYAHVVDPCNKRVVILPVGESEQGYQLLLDEGPAAGYEPRGVALASTPIWAEFNAFVTQGPYLHTYAYSSSNSDGTFDIENTIDLDLVLPFGYPLIELTGLYAADPIELDGETYYLLYVVGTETGPIPQPWVLVFDQEMLLRWPSNPDPVLMAAEQLGESGGAAIDVAVGATTDGGHRQEAFASVLSLDAVQRFYTIVVYDDAGFGISLDPWNDEGIPFSGSEPDSLGLDFDSLGLEAHGVFQTSSVVSDLYTGESSCNLVGDPTDVAIWGPDSWGGYVHFATVSTGAGAGTLLGYNEGVCPYSGGELEMSVSSRPLSLALSSDTSDSPWVYTANGSGDVTAIQLSIIEHETGATITIVDEFPVVTEGCPSAIVFRDPVYGECATGKVGIPRPPPVEPCPTTKYCKLNPTDPLCISTFCAKGPAT